MADTSFISDGYGDRETKESYVTDNLFCYADDGTTHTKTDSVIYFYQRQIWRARATKNTVTVIERSRERKRENAHFSLWTVVV